MRSIGFRASPQEVFFAVVSRSPDRDLFDFDISSIKVPRALSNPDRLRFIRTNLLDLAREKEVSRAGIRIAESVSQNISYERIHLEGVIQEMLSSSFVEKYFCGQIATISKIVGLSRSEITEILDGKNHFNVDRWDKYSKKERESFIVSIAALNL